MTAIPTSATATSMAPHPRSRLHARIVLAALSVCGLAALAWAAFVQPLPRIIYNPSDSVAVGWYRVDPLDHLAGSLPRPLSVGSIVLTRLPADVAALAAQRGYGDTPQPATPYQSAAQVWDERIGSARVQAKNWRFMAFGCLTLAVLMAGGLVWRSAQSIVTPYVIEVDNAGQVRAVGEAATPYQPSDAQIAYHLGRFIGLVRSLSIDPIVVRQNWLDAYDYTTDKGAVVLNEYARVADSFSRIGQESVTVQVSSVTRASDSSFNVRWTEMRFVNGALDRTERWNAVVSIVQQTPRTEQRVRKNPLGIYVNGLSWSRELEANEGAKP